MKVLGLDIATSTGWALLSNGKIIDYGLIKLKSKNSHRIRLKNLRKEVTELIEKHKPDLIALETVYIAKGRRSNPKTAGLLNRMRGVVMECVPENIDIIDVVNRQAKKEVIGKGNIDKEAVFNWAVSTYNLDNLELKVHNDITDAILLATWGETEINHK